MPGSPEGEQPFSFNLFKALYPDRDQKRNLRDTPTDYSAMFAYIRADKSTPDFLEDLRDNKTHFDQARARFNRRQAINAVFGKAPGPSYTICVKTPSN
jgi:hypothetical protein